MKASSTFAEKTIITGTNLDEIKIAQEDSSAHLRIGKRNFVFRGHWVTGEPWERFGLYNNYVVIRHDGAVLQIPAHAGELIPGSTEDLVTYLKLFGADIESPRVPLTLELDTTYRCVSKDCGGRCFSAAYRNQAPKATIPVSTLKEIVRDFSDAGGRIIRFDGGGDPLSHPAVRNGELPELAHQLSLKSTILTSGDLLAQSNLHRIGYSNCYLRISLNAATDKTRQLFHGNQISLNQIFTTIERFAGWLRHANPSLPIGGTFLIDKLNYHEVLACAIKARDSGVSHFAVRRVLGPTPLRTFFLDKELAEINDIFAKMDELITDQFRVFIPWRPLNEPDINPAKGEFEVSRCWQSTFKTVIEPEPTTGGFQAQLCGRYRGSGFGQLIQMQSLLSSQTGLNWSKKWAQSFDGYHVPRSTLPRICNSCIDRGFILLIDRLLNFLNDLSKDFYILHLHKYDHQDQLPFLQI